MIAVFRTRPGRSFLRLTTPVRIGGGPLAEGMLAGDAVVCPLHAFRFELATGDCDQPHACAVKTYAVEQIDGEIYISLPPNGDRKEPA